MRLLSFIPTSPSRSIEHPDTNADDNKQRSQSESSPRSKRQGLHELYAAAKNRFRPSRLSYKPPKKAESNNAEPNNAEPNNTKNQSFLEALPPELVLQVLEDVLPPDGLRRENTQAVASLHRVSKDARGFLQAFGFDFMRNNRDYVRTQEAWKKFFPSLEQKTEKYTDTEAGILRGFAFDAEFLEVHQKQAWLTCIEEKLQSFGIKDHNVSVLLNASGGGAFLKPSTLPDEDRTRVFNLMMRLDPQQLLKSVEGTSQRQLSSLSPEEHGQIIDLAYGHLMSMNSANFRKAAQRISHHFPASSTQQCTEIFKRIYAESPSEAIKILAPAFNRLSQKSQKKFLRATYAGYTNGWNQDIGLIAYACKTFLLQSEKQQKSTLQALKNAHTGQGRLLERALAEEFLKPANGLSGPSLFSRIPRKMQEELVKTLPSLADSMESKPMESRPKPSRFSQATGKMQKKLAESFPSLSSRLPRKRS